MPTITEVAKAAGVSIATVSRVINHLPQVAPETAQVVQRAMAELGYRPTPMEQRRRREPRPTAPPTWPTGVVKGSLGLLFPDHRPEALQTPLSGRLMHGLHSLVSSHGMSMQTMPLAAHGGLPPALLQPSVDGLVVRATVPLLALAQMLPPMPVVWLMETCESDLPRGDQVLEDTAAIGRLAARHLWNRGHRVVATISNDPTHPCYSRRIAAFGAEFRAAGGQVVDIDGGCVVPPVELPALAARVHSDPLRPTGLFIPLSDAGIAALQRGFRVPGGLTDRPFEQVVCGNDPALLGAMDPSMTNIDIHPEEMVRAAGELLLWRLSNPTAARRRVMIEPSIGPVGSQH